MRLYQLDGLRALALLMVVLIHHGLLRSGWVGVDIFFVLSGFLITGILRHESAKPAFWKSFYIKRAARIMPPLIILFVVALATVGNFKWGYLGYLLSGGNIIQLTPYRLELLGPLWSLAIEEHFYFVWPVAVKEMRRETLLRLSLMIVVLSPFLRVLGALMIRHWWKANAEGWDNPIFLLTPFRIDGLAAGAALALFLEGGRRPAFLSRWAGAASFVPAALFLGIELVDKSFRRTTDSLLFDGLGYSLVVLASFFLVSFLVLKPDAIASRILSSKPVVYIGTISYGFYLYQEAVIFAVRHFAGVHTSLKVLFVPDFILTTLLASISFYLVEKPIMTRTRIWLKHLESKHKRELESVGFSLEASTSSEISKA